MGWPKGVPRSPETRAKIAAAGRGRVVSPETRAKLSALQKQRLKDDPEYARRLQLAGSAVPRKPGPVAPRFWAKVNKDGPVPDYAPHLGPCWIWTGARHVGEFPYGNLRMPKGQTNLAHRISYELNVGPIPDDLELDHLCMVPQCVNPAHLEPVTRSTNKQRGVDSRPAATHCARGHAFGDEPWTAPDGVRRCLECRRIRDRKYARKRREKLRTDRIGRA